MRRQYAGIDRRIAPLLNSRKCDFHGSALRTKRGSGAVEMAFKGQHGGSETMLVHVRTNDAIIIADVHVAQADYSLFAGNADKNATHTF